VFFAALDLTKTFCVQLRSIGGILLRDFSGFLIDRTRFPTSLC